LLREIGVEVNCFHGREVGMVKIIGIIVFAIGIFLWCGNVFRFFPTFPLAGYLTMVVGGVIIKKGASMA
jgi:hypothetical protein